MEYTMTLPRSKLAAEGMVRAGVGACIAAPAHAEFVTCGRTAAWYAPRMEAARQLADGDVSGSAWQSLLEREGITEILLSPAELTPAQRAGLQAAGARPMLAVGEAECWQRPAGRSP